MPCDVYNQGNGSFRVEYVVSEVGESNVFEDTKCSKLDSMLLCSNDLFCLYTQPIHSYRK